MSLKFIRDAYSVPAFRGRKVRFHKPDCYSRVMVITGSNNALLKGRWADDPAGPQVYLHPTWHLEYLSENTEADATARKDLGHE